MRSYLLAILASTLLPLSACNLYFSGGDDGDPPCADWGGGSGGGLEAPELLRNPDTGACEDFGWTNPPPYPCDGVCGPCAGADGEGGTGTGTTTPVPTDPEGEGEGEGSPESDRAPGAEAPVPTWGYCESYCTGLDEQGCLATAGCRGIYESIGADAPLEFQECWQTDFSGPILVQTCEGLDATSCSMNDDCIAVHEFSCPDGGDEPGLIPPPCVAGAFWGCHSEPSEDDGCYDDTECGEGFSCNADEVCLPPPGSGSGQSDAPQACYGHCVPAPDPGECDGPVICTSLPPLCEAGTTPGIANGCWTGACISLSECPSVDCADIVGEPMCIARDDCSAYYVGVDCECTPNGCSCSDWAFDSCNQS